MWLKLEDAIRSIDDENGKGHVWAIVGPVFGDSPASIQRGAGRFLPVPDAYFCIVVEPTNYPYDTPSRVYTDCFLIPQGAPRSSRPEHYPSSLDEIEELTQLAFFPKWGRELALQQSAPGSSSRMQDALRKQRKTEELLEKKRQAEAFAERSKATSVGDLVDQLKAEASRLSSPDGRAPTDNELAQIATIQHTISWLLRAMEIVGEELPAPAPTDGPRDAPTLGTIITYKIVGDVDDRLKKAARLACNFWNHFVQPKYNVVVRLDVFTEPGLTIAKAWTPYPHEDTNTWYGPVAFNTKYLANFSGDEIAGTIIHEIGHTLGIGLTEWNALFDRKSGRFTDAAIAEVPALGEMVAELEHGDGTAFAHWDEAIFDRELMTGFKDYGEHVLPVTIEVLRLFGHSLKHPLTVSTPLDALLREAEAQPFFRQADANRLELDFHRKTDPMEVIPHPRAAPDDPQRDGRAPRAD